MVEGNGTRRRGQPEGGGPIWDRSDRPAWMRAINGAGRALRRIGVRPRRFEPDEFIAAAERKTGLSEWGDDRFRVGLVRLIDVFERQAHPSTFGRIAFRAFCIDLLVNRLKVEDEIRRHPEILDVPIRRPLFVTGLPRSGTTFLHNLLSQNPAGRPLLFWESFEPTPPPRPETYATDPRIARARKALRNLCAMSPRMLAAHEYEAENPEECNTLAAHTFHAAFFGFMFDAGEYIEWLEEQELGPLYQHLRRQFQLLSLHIPGDPWVLKAPAHLFALDALLASFPDASIVITHRDPTQTIPSLCSLSASFRGIFSDRVDLRRMGSEYVEAMGVGVDRSVGVRAWADPARFLDVSYPSMIADPVGTVAAICERFDYPFTAEFEARVRRWLADHPQHKNGVHRYSLDQFGIDPSAIHRRFAAYYRWLDTNFPEGAFRPLTPSNA